MDKVIVNPDKIRGLGNIISPGLSREDFNKYLSNVSVVDSYNGVPCFSLVTYTNDFVLTIDTATVASGSDVTLTATLTNISHEGISGKTIKFYIVEE